MVDKNFITNLKPYKDFKYWFKVDICNNVLHIYDNVTHDCISSISNFTEVISDPISNDSDRCNVFEQLSGCIDDFAAFKLRPEYSVYNLVVANSVEESIDIYEKLLIGSTMILSESSGLDPDTVIDRVCKCLEWLRTTDFYTCPSSRAYHDANHSGLLIHTLKVANKVHELFKVPTFYNNVQLARAVRSALLHDWCKIGLYESFMKNVKNLETGVWEQEVSYRYKENRSTLLGHGASSMYLASKFFKLSYEEALAIRWHMGEFNVAHSEVEELSQACRKYPLVYMLQFADRLACVEY